MSVGVVTLMFWSDLNVLAISSPMPLDAPVTSIVLGIPVFFLLQQVRRQPDVGGRGDLDVLVRSERPGDLEPDALGRSGDEHRPRHTSLLPPAAGTSPAGCRWAW